MPHPQEESTATDSQPGKKRYLEPQVHPESTMVRWVVVGNGTLSDVLAVGVMAFICEADSAEEPAVSQNWRVLLVGADAIRAVLFGHTVHASIREARVGSEGRV